MPAGEWKTAKSRQLLRLLALHAGEPVRVEWLIDWLWPSVPSGKGRGSLRTAASHLRRVLATEQLHRIGDTLVLDGAEVDALAFRRGATAALRRLVRGELGPGLAAARTTLELYRGDLAEDEPYLDPILEAQDQLRLLHTELLTAAAGAALELGIPSEALWFGTQALEADPACERACRLVMRTYLCLGEAAMAARSYERCRRALADEIGVDPSPETEELHLALLRGRAGHDTGAIQELLGIASGM